MARGDPQPLLALPLQKFYGDAINLPDNIRVFQAISQDLLTIEDDVELV